jgi:hypothetical protein
MIERCFDPISLADLNAKAEMLTRLDNKYVVPMEVLERASLRLAKHFDILEIDGKRSFGYRTQYFDTPDLCSFRHHVQGRRRRSKVRTRHYLDADICFVEVKLKTRRKITVKKRLAHDPDMLDRLNEPAARFVDDAHHHLYARGGLAAYDPVMQMQYERMTLVARTGGERLTIDRSLQFWDDRRRERISADMVIIETKSAFGRGIADTVLRAQGNHPVGSCSKYCIGLAALGIAPRYNKFMPAFRRLLPHLAQGGPEHLADRLVNFDQPMARCA